MKEDESDPQELLEKTHRKEKQELQEKIMALKKYAAQGEKKKKKEINAEISKLEGDLNEKHSEEMMELLLNGVTVSDEAEEVVENVKSICDSKSEPEEKGPRVSKAQKRREKKADKEEERRRDIERQEEENLTGARTREQEKIKELLEARGLKLAEVPSDGDCMFAGLVHQLACLGVSSSVASLRQSTAEELRRDKETYWPFLSHPTTGEMLTDQQFEEYCTTMANTPAWGGQVELRALSTVLGRPLSVVQAEGVECVVVGQEMEGAGLTLTYHRHMYGLGEHYNSVTRKKPE